jgi:hypothetical protein
MYACAGSADDLRVEAGDILELMAAANFFQLDGLLHYCEYRCADLIDLDTIVSYYIHAKVSAYFRAKRILASLQEVENYTRTSRPGKSTKFSFYGSAFVCVCQLLKAWALG